MLGGASGWGQDCAGWAAQGGCGGTHPAWGGAATGGLGTARGQVHEPAGGSTGGMGVQGQEVGGSVGRQLGGPRQGVGCHKGRGHSKREGPEAVGSGVPGSLGSAQGSGESAGSGLGSVGAPSLTSPATPEGQASCPRHGPHPACGRRRGGGCARLGRRRESGSGCSGAARLALRSERRQREGSAASPAPSPPPAPRSPRTEAGTLGRGAAGHTATRGTAEGRADGAPGSDPPAQESPVSESRRGRGRGASAADPLAGRGGAGRGRLGASLEKYWFRRGSLCACSRHRLGGSLRVRALGVPAPLRPGLAVGTSLSASLEPLQPGRSASLCVSTLLRVTVRSCLPGGARERTGCAGPGAPHGVVAYVCDASAAPGCRCPGSPAGSARPAEAVSLGGSGRRGRRGVWELARSVTASGNQWGLVGCVGGAAAVRLWVSVCAQMATR